MIKNLPVIQETQVRFLGWKDPLEKGMATHSGSLPGEFHGRRSLEGYSPWGCRESDTTERARFLVLKERLCQVISKDLLSSNSIMIPIF